MLKRNIAFYIHKILSYVLNHHNNCKDIDKILIELDFTDIEHNNDYIISLSPRSRRSSFLS